MSTLLARIHNVVRESNTRWAAGLTVPAVVADRDGVVREALDDIAGVVLRDAIMPRAAHDALLSTLSERVNNMLFLALAGNDRVQLDGAVRLRAAMNVADMMGARSTATVLALLAGRRGAPVEAVDTRGKHGRAAAEASSHAVLAEMRAIMRGHVGETQTASVSVHDGSLGHALMLRATRAGSAHPAWQRLVFWAPSADGAERAVSTASTVADLTAAAFAVNSLVSASAILAFRWQAAHAPQDRTHMVTLLVGYLAVTAALIVIAVAEIPVGATVMMAFLVNVFMAVFISSIAHNVGRNRMGHIWTLIVMLLLSGHYSLLQFANHAMYVARGEQGVVDTVSQGVLLRVTYIVSFVLAVTALAQLVSGGAFFLYTPLTYYVTAVNILVNLRLLSLVSFAPVRAQ